MGMTFKVFTDNDYDMSQGIGKTIAEEIKKQIDKLLEAGVISPSRSAWGANVLLVPKPIPGEFRMAIDYRKLNEYTKREIYALPRCDDIFDALSNKLFCVLHGNIYMLFWYCKNINHS